jgi:N-formylglutamate amidohydrolase
MHDLWKHHLWGIFLLITLAFTQALLCAEEKTSPSKFLTLWAGMLPVILAAPHGGRESLPTIGVRRGIGVAGFATGRDHNTDELAEIMAFKIHEKLAAKPFLIVARFDRKYVDANRPRKEAYESEAARPYYDAYHSALQHACAQVRWSWGRGLLLDIHGQGSDADTIFRGTGNGRSVSDLLDRFGKQALAGPKSVLGQMELRGYRIAPAGLGDQREQRYTGGYTTRTYGSHQGTRVDAIQLELGTNLRSRQNLERTASDLADAVQIFAREYLLLSDRPLSSDSWQPNPNLDGFQRN